MVLLLSCAVLAVPTPGKWDPKLQTKVSQQGWAGEQQCPWLAGWLA